MNLFVLLTYKFTAVAVIVPQELIQNFDRNKWFACFSLSRSEICVHVTRRAEVMLAFSQYRWNRLNFIIKSFHQ